MRPALKLSILLPLALAPVTALCQSQSLPVYPEKAQVVQRLNAFDNPEGAIFSADGKHVFISNAAELGNPDKGFHWTRGQGYISKLAVNTDGTLTMVEKKLVSGLTAPLGMAVLPVDVGNFPRGTIFVAEAAAPLAEPDGTEVKDPNRVEARLLAFNEQGKVLGSIPLGKESAAAKASGVVSTLPNALAFDKQGNLYMAETGIGGGQFQPPIQTQGGVYMFPASSLQALASGRDAPVRYIGMPQGGPDGIEVAPDGTIQFNTVGLAAGLKDPAEGGMYRMSKQDFESGKAPEPFGQGLGALDGLDFAGSMRLDTEIKNNNALVVTPPSGDKSYLLPLDQDIKLTGPADIAVHKLPDGSYLVVIPELSATSPNNGDNPVTVVRLPADFESVATQQ
jgi:hypothetical protein